MFHCLRWSPRTGKTPHFRCEDWWSLVAKAWLKTNSSCLLMATVGDSSCRLCALNTPSLGALLKMLGMGSSTGLRCEVSGNAPTHGSKECEAASSPPWPGSGSRQGSGTYSPGLEGPQAALLGVGQSAPRLLTWGQPWFLACRQTWTHEVLL